MLARRALLQLPADVAGAGERQRGDALVLDEDVADLGRRPTTTLSQPGGKPGLLHQLGEQQRRERRLRRRLQHDGAAGGERGRELVRDEVAREVERRDRADDPEREAQRERELALAGLRRVHRHHLARELARLDRGEGVRRHRARRLDARGLQRLAGLGADRPRDLVVAAADEARDLDEDLGALVRRQRLAHRALGGVDRAPRLGGAGLRDRGRRPRRSRASAPRSTRRSRPTRRRRRACVRQRSWPWVESSGRIQECGYLTCARSSTATSSSRASAGRAACTSSSIRTAACSSTPG